MTINHNSYLQGLEAVLTPTPDGEYIEIDTETNTCWRTSIKPDDTKVAAIFAALKEGIEKRMAASELLSVGELQSREMYIKSISQKARCLSGRFLEKMNSLDRIVRAKFSTNYEKALEKCQTDVAEQYSLLDATLIKYLEQTEERLEATLEKKEDVVKMKSLDVDSLSTEEILEIAVIAFEHSTQEDTSLWVSQHEQLFDDLYSWICDALREEIISIGDVDFITKAINRGGVYFPNFRVPFRSGDETFTINEFQFIVYEEWLEEFLTDYDEESVCYQLTEKKLQQLKYLIEDITTGKIEGYEGKSLDEILDILNLKYFQYDREFCVNTFRMLNERGVGVRLSCGEKEVIVKLDKMTPEAAKILQHPLIKGDTYELNLSNFDTLISCDAEKTQEILTLLLENLPDIEFLWLPVPCSISEKSLKLLKKLEGLKVIHLDFSHCNNYREFASFFIPLYEAMQYDKWRVCIENTGHLKKDDALKLLAHFPHSKSVSLEGTEDLVDEDVLRVCVNLPMLESLTLNECIGISDAALSGISEYGQNLKALYLRNCVGITDKGVSAMLAGVGESLTQLDFGGTNMTTAVALAIADHCKDITCLSFERCCNIVDASVKAIAAECKDIQYYDLRETSITDDGVKAIAGTGNSLINISFYGCQGVTESSIRELLQYCKELRRVDARGTVITNDQLMQLRKDYPNVTILGDD